MKSPESRKNKIFLDDFEIRLLNRVKDGTIDETGKVAKGDDIGTRIITTDLENLLLKAGLDDVLDHLKKQHEDGGLTKELYVQSLISKIVKSERLEKDNIERSGTRNVVAPPSITPKHSSTDTDKIKGSTKEALAENNTDSLRTWVRSKAKKNNNE